MQATFQDRVIGAAGAAGVVVALAWVLLMGLHVERDDPAMAVVRLLGLQTPAQRPHVPKPPRRPAAKTAGASAPRNLRNQAAEVVAPPTIAPAPSPMATAPIAGTGMAAQTGASVLPGPGEGAGGTGQGPGGGGDGDGGDDLPPRQTGGALRFSDVPAALRDARIGGTVSVRYRVERNGRVSGCSITGSSGSAELDSLTCRLIERRFRFDPSRDREGRPVGAIIEESHRWIYDRPGGDEPQE